MKRRIMLSIAIVLGIALISLISSDSSVEAQNQIRIVADTNMITLGSGQILRITVVGIGPRGNPDNLCFRRVEYGEGTCNADGVCKHAISSQIESAMIPLVRGEGASFDIPRTAFGVRGVVLSNNLNVRVNAMIIDSATGKIVSATDGHNGAPGNVSEE